MQFMGVLKSCATEAKKRVLVFSSALDLWYLCALVRSLITMRTVESSWSNPYSNVNPNSTLFLVLFTL